MNEHPEFTVETENIEATQEQLEAVYEAVRAVLGAERAEGRYPCIILTDDDTIHACNRDYRSVDRPTDVLSFPADEGEDLLAPPDGFLGDIMISVPTAERQATELGHSLERELAFLTVHGMLHLLGYDHIEPDDESRMLTRQRALIAEIEPRLAPKDGARSAEGKTHAGEDEKRMGPNEITEMSIKERKSELIALALKARERAYVPYSGFRVGACLLTRSGQLFLGCNIENAAYSPTNCAERTALFKAVSEGETEFAALAVASDSEHHTYPCGVCRQVLSEFCAADMPVFCANRDGSFVETTLGGLLPMAFTKEDMGS